MLDLGRVERAPARQLQQPEPPAPFHEDVQPAVLEPFEHVGDRRERADLTQPPLVREHEPELAVVGEALGDQLLVPVLEDMQRHALRRQEDELSGKSPISAISQRLRWSRGAATA